MCGAKPPNSQMKLIFSDPVKTLFTLHGTRSFLNWPAERAG